MCSVAFTWKQFDKCLWTLIHNNCSKITFLTLLPHFSGVSELISLRRRSPRCEIHILKYYMMTSSNGKFSMLLTLCVGNSPVTGEFPSQRPVTRSFDVFFDLRLNKRLSKQSWGWWFEMPLRSLWCIVMKITIDTYTCLTTVTPMMLSCGWVGVGLTCIAWIISTSKKCCIIFHMRLSQLWCHHQWCTISCDIITRTWTDKVRHYDVWKSSFWSSFMGYSCFVR